MRRTLILSAAATLVLAIAASTASAQTVVVYPRGFSPTTPSAVGSQPAVVYPVTGSVARPGTVYTTSAVPGAAYYPTTASRVVYNNQPRIGYTTTTVPAYRPVTVAPTVVTPRYVTTTPQPTLYGRGNGVYSTTQPTMMTVPSTTYAPAFGTAVPTTTYGTTVPTYGTTVPTSYNTSAVIPGSVNSRGAVMPTTPGTYTASNGTTIIIPGPSGAGTAVASAVTGYNTTPRFTTTVNNTSTYGTAAVAGGSQPVLTTPNAPVSYSTRPFGGAAPTMVTRYNVQPTITTTAPSYAPRYNTQQPMGTAAAATQPTYTVTAPRHGTPMAGQPTVVYPRMNIGTSTYSVTAPTYPTTPGLGTAGTYYSTRPVTGYGTMPAPSPVVTSPVISPNRPPVIITSPTPGGMTRTLEAPRFLRPGTPAGGSYAGGTVLPATNSGTTIIVPR